MSNLNESINLQDASGKNHKFDSIEQMIAFLTVEIDYWIKYIREKANFPYDFRPKFLHYLEKILAKSNDLLKSKGSISAAINIATDIHDEKRNLKEKWVYSGLDYSHFWGVIFVRHGSIVAEEFLNIVANKQKSHYRKRFNDSQYPDNIIGVAFASYYLSYSRDLFEEGKSEQNSFKYHLDKVLESKKSLVENIHTFKGELNNWKSDQKKDWQAWFTKSSDEFKTSQNELKDKTAALDDEWRRRLTSLEETYEEKLRLSAPVKYWEEAINRFRNQGWLWLFLLSMTVISGLVGLGFFFTVWLTGKELGINLGSIQGVILFGSILTTFAFFVRVLSRLTFSSFHLMRDAEERRQLTYLYLALNKEGAMETGSRDIVLQALFSRSESGLLVKESGPKMPNQADILKLFPKK